MKAISSGNTYEIFDDSLQVFDKLPNGIHYFEQRFSKDLSYTQMHDQIKNNYCQKNQIKLIRIPYWDFNDIEDKLEVIIENDYKPFVVS